MPTSSIRLAERFLDHPAQRTYVIALSAVPSIGWRTMQKIIRFARQKQLSLSEWWQSSDSIWLQSGVTPKQIEQLQKFQRSYQPKDFLAQIAAQHITCCTIADLDYPPLLREIADPPWVLYCHDSRENTVKTRLQAWQQNPIAVVGTRHSTVYGSRVTRDLVLALVTQLQSTIVSGGMYGIDMTAHTTAVQVIPDATTIAVLGCGFNRLSQRQSQEYQQLQLQGKQLLLVSEYAPDTPAAKGTFLARNRIVAGSTLATIVIEAGQKSGSLVTAQLALDEGRQVWAVPGSIYHPMSRGTNELIAQGAGAISSPAQIIQELAEICQQPVKQAALSPIKLHSSPPSTPQQQVYSLLKQDPLSFDALLAKTRSNMIEISSVLSQMELLGLVSKQGSLWHAVQ